MPATALRIVQDNPSKKGVSARSTLPRRGSTIRWAGLGAFRRIETPADYKQDYDGAEASIRWRWRSFDAGTAREYGAYFDPDGTFDHLFKQARQRWDDSRRRLQADC
jgi:hypothetical protein